MTRMSSARAAKEAWDALTDEQKELVEGENADPDYFGRDTGDASLDDPRNQDEIGDKEILVVSFGTSFNDSRVKDIKSIEDSIQEAFPDWAVRRAFTAQDHYQPRLRLVTASASTIWIRHWIEPWRTELKSWLSSRPTSCTVLSTTRWLRRFEKYQDKFEQVAVAEPLLGECWRRCNRYQCR